MECLSLSNTKRIDHPRAWFGVPRYLGLDEICSGSTIAQIIITNRNTSSEYIQRVILRVGSILETFQYLTAFPIRLFLTFKARSSSVDYPIC